MLLGRQSYVIRLRAETTKPVDSYDILDPGTGQVIGAAWEEEPKLWARWVRALWGRDLVPTTVHVGTQDKAVPTFSIREVSTMWPARVNVTDAGGQLLGYFKAKFATIGGGLTVFDARDRPVAEIEGGLNLDSYKFINREGRELGAVSCEAIARDLSRLPPTEGYVVSLKDAGESLRATGVLLLAAALALDILYRARD